jgi:histidinol-phosphate aminotransferase
MDAPMYRKEVKLYKPYIPGKSIKEVKKDYGLKEIIKLASNENPIGPSKKAVERAKDELNTINLYPDPMAIEVREAIALKIGVNMENIFVGNGAEQILQIIANCFINEGDEAIMAHPSFDLYASTVAFLGGIPNKIALKDFKHDFIGFRNRIVEKTKLIYICNPNNPTGNITKKTDLDTFLKNIPDNIVVVLDEAYYDFARINPEYPDSKEIIKLRKNTIVLRTFSKIAGIAGIRIGYAISSEDIVENMHKIKPTFTVNSVAQAAALGALADSEHIKNTVEINYQSLAQLEKGFNEMGLEYVKSNANFIFVNVKKDSRIVFKELMKKGIIIRPGFNWGYKNWIRVSTGNKIHMKKFLDELSSLICCN